MPTKTADAAPKKKGRGRSDRRRGHGEGTYYTEMKNGKKVYCWKIRVGSEGDQRAVVVKSTTTEGRTERVRQRLAELQSRGKALAIGTPLTIEQHCRKWLDERVKPRRAAKTSESYEYHIERFIIPAVGKVRVRDADQATLQRIYDYAVAQPSDRTPKKGATEQLLVSKATALSAVRVACNALNIKVADAKKEGLNLPANPEPRDRVLEEEEIEAIFRALFATRNVKGCPGETVPLYRDRHLIAFILNTGVRVSESIGIAIPMLNLREGTLTVQHQLSRFKDDEDMAQWELKETKGKKVRVLPLNAQALHHIRAQLQMIAEDKALLGDAYDDNGLLFATGTGKPHSIRNVNRSLAQVIARAGVANCTVHDLRRTYLTYLAEQEEDRKAVAALAGHTSPATTERVYIVARKRKIEQAAAKVGFGAKQLA